MDDDQLYVYRVTTVVEIVDGDTYDLVVDPGFHLSFAHRFRLNGWDTPELRKGSDFEKAEGQRATRAAYDWVSAAGDRLVVRTWKADSFGRWLAGMFIDDEDWTTPAGSLGHHLASLSLATAWPTRWREVFDPTD